MFFKLCISQRYINNIGRNWKKSVCILAKNFTHLHISKIQGRLYENKELNFPKFAYNFPCENVNFSLIDETHITVHSLKKKNTTKFSKCYIQAKIKNNDYWIFLIFFLYIYILTFFLELQTREFEHEVTTSETHAQSFNLWLIS